MSRASARRPVSQRQPLEADHGVAAPVGEPGVAGDHRAGGVALRVQDRLVARARVRLDDELIGGQHQLGGQLGAHPAAQLGPRLGEQAQPPLLVERVHLERRQRLHLLPGLRRRDQANLAARLQRSPPAPPPTATCRASRSRAPAPADSAARRRRCPRRDLGGAALDAQAQRRQGSGRAARSRTPPADRRRSE